MFTHKSAWGVLALLIVFTMVVGACAPTPTPAPKVEPTAAPPAPPTAAPTAAP